MKEDREVNLHKRLAMGSKTDGTHLKHGGAVEGAAKRYSGGGKTYKKGGKMMKGGSCK
jgi:hypothetical protein